MWAAVSRIIRRPSGLQRDLGVVLAVQLLLVLAVADWFTTVRLVPGGYAREANPLARALLDHGSGALLLAKLALVGIVYVIAVRVRVRAWLARTVWVAVGSYSAAVGLNVLNLTRIGG